MLGKDGSLSHVKEGAQHLLVCAAYPAGLTPLLSSALSLLRYVLSGPEQSVMAQVYPRGLELWLASRITVCGTIWQAPRNMSGMAKQGTLELPIMKMTGNPQRLLCL